jgi:GNAT superfamily N-acetyltransferase
MKPSTPQNARDQIGTPVVEIRPASAGDVPDIARLLWDDEYGRDRESTASQDEASYLSAFHQIESDPNSEVFVATLDGAVVGCLQLTIIPGLSYRGIYRALVEDVRVDRRCRSRGVGSLLLSTAEARATERGCRMIELFVHADRNDAHRFYESAGYVGAHRGFRKKLL